MGVPFVGEEVGFAVKADGDARVAVAAELADPARPVPAVLGTDVVDHAEDRHDGDGRGEAYQGQRDREPVRRVRHWYVSSRRTIMIGIQAAGMGRSRSGAGVPSGAIHAFPDGSYQMSMPVTRGPERRASR